MVEIKARDHVLPKGPSTDLNQCKGMFPIKRLECNCLLERVGFSLEVTQIVDCDYCYNIAKKLSHLKDDNLYILVKTLCFPGGEHNDGKDPEISVLHVAQHPLTSACFILFHQVCCNLHPMINTITNENLYDLDLQTSQEKEKSNDHFCKNYPKWDPTDPELSLINTWAYFESLHGTSGSPCSCMI